MGGCESKSNVALVATKLPKKVIVDRQSEEYQEWMARVQADGSLLRIAPPELRHDRQIVLVACSVHGPAIEYASPDLRNDKLVVLAAIKNEGFAMQYANPRLCNDKDVVLAAIEQTSWAFRIASQHLRSDKQFVMIVVSKSGRALQFCTRNLQNDIEVVMTAVTQDGRALQFASPQLRNDKQTVLAAVQQTDSAIQFASSNLRGDKDVVLAALILSTVKDEDDLALFYASKGLRNDIEVVLAAVEINGLALQYASKELCANKDVVLTAVKSNPDARVFASENLKERRDILVDSGIFFKGDNQDQKRKMPITKKIVMSTRVTLEPTSQSDATNFISLFRNHRYIQTGHFELYNISNKFNKRSSCDPHWVDFDHPCRGTRGTCRFDMALKPTAFSYLSDECCWRYACRWQLNDAQVSGGFMLQLVERGVLYGAQMLGKGQKIEEDMGYRVGIKIFKVYRPVNMKSGLEDWFEETDVEKVVATIRQWYDGGCKDKQVCIVHLNHKEEY